MKHLLFPLLLGASLLAAGSAGALTIVTPGQNRDDAANLRDSEDAPMQRLRAPDSASRDFAPNTIFRSRSGSLSFGVTRQDSRQPLHSDSPYYGMEPGSGFRMLNQQ